MGYMTLVLLEFRLQVPALENFFLGKWGWACG
jgi:hypothetical protein